MTRWLLDHHPDFPSADVLAARLPSAIVVTRSPADDYDWPADLSEPLVLYGTMRMLAAARRHPQLARCVFDDYTALRCSSYYRRVYEHLGRTALIVPLRALPLIDWAKLLGPRVFIRPDSNYKLFDARIVSAAAVADFARDEAVHLDELVVASEVVELGPEYRCVFRDGRAVCSSSYPLAPFAPAPAAALAFASRVARDLGDAYPFVTIDVALGADRARLVEVGGVNSWGLYGSDPMAFIAAMESAASDR